jgi:hypothetical protein
MTGESETRQKDDDELARYLRFWKAPAPPQRLDARIIASYRSRAGVSRLQRLWWVRVSLPLPIAILLAVFMLAAANLALRGLTARGGPGVDAERAASPTGLADLRPLPDVRLRVIREGGEGE